ncbi:ABC transporter ATP-binding protein [Microbacterium capsulatum]|uniref:ABC transporter ATP-binding protein n=1 Tax=Microbacterium capsulatum TaxID=3041921 RepID=A0ABU0XIP4_9MICO|nr:ABC transporter ATP-binding protein [Microbacterium sp. ASV81]MDQ4215008.1 ABC transporter ATP-binding protein [Microbacterium sp. ASV81]
MSASPADTGATGSLPALWRGRRRRYLVALVASGLAQALLAGTGAHVIRTALERYQKGAPAAAGPAPAVWTLFGLLIAALLLVGVLQYGVRVWSELLSQDYVHDIRIGLMRRNLTAGLTSSLGVSVTRLSNDLTSIRNWITLGIVPVLVGVPLIVGTCAIVVVLDPAYLLSIGVPLALLLGALALLAEPLFRRTMELRRSRGRLSAHLGDMLLATPSIRSGGGIRRELKRAGRYSDAMVEAAVRRARFSGLVRGSTITTTGLITAFTVGAGLLWSIPASTTAAALTLIGFLVAPVHDLGRAVEYRQMYRAAQRMVGPATLLPAEPERPRRPDDAPRRRTGVPSAAPAGVFAAPRSTSDGTAIPGLAAAPGDRIVADFGSRSTTAQVLSQFAGLATATEAILVDGTDLRAAGDDRLRRIVGYAAQGMLLGRLTILTAVRYRSPAATDADARAALQRVGLGERVDRLAKGDQTVLRHGGDPLTVPERARLLLARALMESPALLVLDHLDADLDPAGRIRLRELLADYPGVVLYAGEHGDDVFAVSRPWQAAEATSRRVRHRPA